MTRLALLVGAALVLVGCATAASAPPGSSVVERSVCPGSLASVLTDLTGAIADRLESLGASFEGQQGFLAVVYDGRRPVVIVAPAALGSWRSRLATEDIGVAPSCVDADLLATVLVAVPRVEHPTASITSAGYDAIRDAIFVFGVGEADLVAAVDAVSPGSGPAVTAAIADRTLLLAP